MLCQATTVFSFKKIEKTMEKNVQRMNGSTFYALESTFRLAKNNSLAKNDNH